MKKLYIIGAGGFGREVLGWARQCPLCGSEWIIGGFIDDNNRLIGKQIHGVEVVSNLEDYYISGEEVNSSYKTISDKKIMFLNCLS